MAEIVFWNPPLTNESPTSIPSSYGFLSAGNHFMTRTVKELCNDQRKDYYVEKKVRRGKPARVVGYHAPKRIIHAAQELKAASEQVRAEKRAKSKVYRDQKELAYRDEFLCCIFELFPSIPEEDASAIARHTTECNSGRVGRTRKLELNEQARLAVVAYARHRYTSYDDRCKAVGTEGQYEEVRRLAAAESRRIVAEWEKPTLDNSDSEPLSD